MIVCHTHLDAGLIEVEVLHEVGQPTISVWVRQRRYDGSVAMQKVEHVGGLPIVELLARAERGRDEARAEIERLQRTIKSAHDYLPLVTGEPVPLVDYNLVPHVIAVAEGWDALDCDREWYRAQAERMRALLREVDDFGVFDANHMRGFDEWLERVQEALGRAQAQETPDAT